MEDGREGLGLEGVLVRSEKEFHRFAPREPDRLSEVGRRGTGHLRDKTAIGGPFKMKKFFVSEGGQGRVTVTTPAPAPAPRNLTANPMVAVANGQNPMSVVTGVHPGVRVLQT